MSRQPQPSGAAVKPTPPIKVAIFSDAARDPSVIDRARLSLEAAGYRLVQMLYSLEEIDKWLQQLNRHSADCPDIVIVDLYSMDDSNPLLYERGNAADRYFGRLVPAGLAWAIRLINPCIRVAITSEASPEDDPIVKIFELGGLVAKGRKNPRGPMIFFPKTEWADSEYRFLRREGRVARVSIGTEPLRAFKRFAKSSRLTRRLINGAYRWIPGKKFWGGDRSWAYEVEEVGGKLVRGKRHLLRTTDIITDYKAVLDELVRLGTRSNRYYNKDLASIVAQAKQGGRKPRVLLIDDTWYHRSPYALRSLQSKCELTVVTSAHEAIAYLAKLREAETSRDQWPDVVLSDLYMAAEVDDDGNLSPKSDKERTKARLLPLGFALALVARSLGLRVGICTDLRHHHNDRIVGLLGNLDTLSSPMFGGAGGVIVFEADMHSVEERFVQGRGIVSTRTISINETPKHWRGKLLRFRGRFPRRARKLLKWADAKSTLYDCFDPQTGGYVTTVSNRDFSAIKDWERVFAALVQSPIVHRDLLTLDPGVLAHFGIKIDRGN